jgi:hypothetical protein
MAKDYCSHKADRSHPNRKTTFYTAVSKNFSSSSAYFLFAVYFTTLSVSQDRLCGLVVSVPGYKSRGPGSIPGATRFFFLRSSGSGTGSTQPRDDN